MEIGRNSSFAYFLQIAFCNNVPAALLQQLEVKKTLN